MVCSAHNQKCKGASELKPLRAKCGVKQHSFMAIEHVLLAIKGSKEGIQIRGSEAVFGHASCIFKYEEQVNKDLRSFQRKVPSLPYNSIYSLLVCFG